MAADAGFKAVEIWDPSGHDLKKLSAIASAAGVCFASCTLNQPRTWQLDRSAGPVLTNITRSIDMARELGSPTMIGLSSDVAGRADAQKNILIENLKRAADTVFKSGLTLVLEPLNSLVDHKGCYLDSSLVAFEIARCVDCPNIRVLFDIYHMQIMEGNLLSNIMDNLEWIGHFHAAGVPGRHEPIDNEVNYPHLMKKIDELGFSRYVGLEYWPTYDHRQSITDSLNWLSMRMH